jgi:hypothetical protein
MDNAEGFKRTRDTILQQLDYLRRELRRLLVEGTERLQSFEEMAAQLQIICRHMEKQFNVRCQLTTLNPDGLSLHPEVLFRTCRFAEELLGNAIRPEPERLRTALPGSDSHRTSGHEGDVHRTDGPREVIARIELSHFRDSSNHENCLPRRSSPTR